MMNRNHTNCNTNSMARPVPGEGSSTRHQFIYPRKLTSITPPQMNMGEFTCRPYDNNVDLDTLPTMDDGTQWLMRPSEVRRAEATEDTSLPRTTCSETTALEAAYGLDPSRSSMSALLDRGLSIAAARRPSRIIPKDIKDVPNETVASYHRLHCTPTPQVRPRRQRRILWKEALKHNTAKTTDTRRNGNITNILPPSRANSPTAATKDHEVASTLGELLNEGIEDIYQTETHPQPQSNTNDNDKDNTKKKGDKQE